MRLSELTKSPVKYDHWKNKFSRKDKQRWQTLINKGYQPKEVAEIEGCSVASVRNHTTPLEREGEMGVKALVDAIHDNESFNEELIITKRNKPLFKLVPIKKDENNG